MDQVPPLPGQKLLAAPKELVKKVSNSDFFDFKNDPTPVVHKLTGISILVVVLIGGFYLLSPQITKIAQSQKELIQGYVPVSSEPRSMNMVLQNPDDDLLVFNNTVVVSGKTSPKAAIVINNGTLNVGVDADLEGNFQKVVDLNSGANILTIQAFDTEGNSKSETRMVYYSEEKI